MATIITPNEGKQFILQNAMSGRTVYMAAVWGQTVAGATVTATSTLAGLQVDPNIARVAVALGAASSIGVQGVPSFTLTAGTGGKTTVQGVVMCSAAAGGVALIVWDTPSTYDMSVAGAAMVVSALNYFMLNPGE